MSGWTGRGNGRQSARGTPEVCSGKCWFILNGGLSPAWVSELSDAQQDRGRGTDRQGGGAFNVRPGLLLLGQPAPRNSGSPAPGDLSLEERGQKRRAS